MEKLVKHLKSTSLLAAMIFLFCAPAKAQSERGILTPADSVAEDPIISMLDSLVNQNYIQRLNISSSGIPQNTFQPSEIPSYSDDVYRARIQKIQTPIPLTYNEQIKEYIDLYAVRKRALTERVMGLANLYFPLYEQILDQQELPLEFKYLSIVESALNPTAVSRAGATGLWQFMLNTGKLYKLKINSFIDERRDPYKSTSAACQYFKDMYSIYHDWLLVIAAYNCGAGNVNKAIARSGGKTSFWEISSYLPRETRGYVPAFIAVTYLMNYASEHNLTAVSPIISYFESDTVLVDHKISLREISNAINTPVDVLRYLNPIYKKGVIPPGNDSYVLRLPTNKINTYLANVENIYKPSIEQENAALRGDASLDDQNYVSKTVKKYYTVKRGERLSYIADRYNCSTQDIRKWNKLKSTKLHSGQKLLVLITTRQKIEPKASLETADKITETAHHESDGSSTTNKEEISSTDSKTTDQDSDSMLSHEKDKDSDLNSTASKTSSTAKLVYHIVQPGDTLWNIAKRYEGATVENLRAINRLSSNALKPGTRLKVFIGG